MKPLSVVVVDDEEHARDALISELSKWSEFKVISECKNGIEAVKVVNELQPELLFLDIQMPKLDGFDVLELLGDQAPYVIFVTAFDEYALRAFEENAFDYILKPIVPERLHKSINKILNTFRGEIEQDSRHLYAMREKQQGYKTRILIRDGSEVHVLAADSVLYIEAADDYVSFQTAGAGYIKLESLVRLEEQLNPYQFCRIHRSFILNVNYLAKIESETKDSKIAYLNNDKQLPISRSGYKKLKKLL